MELWALSKDPYGLWDGQVQRSCSSSIILATPSWTAGLNAGWSSHFRSNRLHKPTAVTLGSGVQEEFDQPTANPFKNSVWFGGIAEKRGQSGHTTYRTRLRLSGDNGAFELFVVRHCSSKQAMGLTRAVWRPTRWSEAFP
jgi:hypothetical protein